MFNSLCIIAYLAQLWNNQCCRIEGNDFQWWVWFLFHLLWQANVPHTQRDAMCLHYTVLSSLAELEQLCRGLAMQKFNSLMEFFPEVLRKDFCPSMQPITSGMIQISSFQIYHQLEVTTELLKRSSSWCGYTTFNILKVYKLIILGMIILLYYRPRNPNFSDSERCYGVFNWVQLHSTSGLWRCHTTYSIHGWQCLANCVNMLT